ncbi:MAG: hypothetical protein GF313_00605 [Caldithrix sp.]|nr:hypothetical protein [Caldithrix sp.]
MHKSILSWTLIIASFLLLQCSSDESEQQNKTQKSDQASETGIALKYSTPDEWVQEKPSSSMRKAQYRWPGVDGAEDAEMAVFFFPGAGGSVKMNLNRWYGQFKQPDGGSTAAKAEEKTIDVDGLDVTVVYVTGTFLKSKSMMMGGPKEEKKNYAMLAAIVETEKAPWFLKATGPQKTIDHWRPEFQEFVKTFHF